VEAKNTTNKKTKAGWRKWLQGQWMVQYVPFILFLALLAVVYIGNGHFADNAIRNTGKATRELKQLQYEYKTLQAEVIYRSKESELANAVAPLGLSRSIEPPTSLSEDTVLAR
jgi:hypothetical protein